MNSGGISPCAMPRARATGKRKMNCVDLEWPQVKWDQGVIKMTGKGSKEIELAITPSIRAILWPLRGHSQTGVHLRREADHRQGDPRQALQVRKR